MWVDSLRVRFLFTYSHAGLIVPGSKHATRAPRRLRVDSYHDSNVCLLDLAQASAHDRGGSELSTASDGTLHT